MRIIATAAASLFLLMSLPAQSAQTGRWYQPTASDVLAVQNLASYYALYNRSGEVGKLADIFALKTPGTSWKTPSGPTDTEGVRKRISAEASSRSRPGDPAVLRVHLQATQVLVFAGDGKTARGLWDAFGPSINGADDVGSWLWMRYGIDFIKEEGQWKIWHMQVFPFFKTPFDKSWTVNAKEQASALGAGQAPARAGTAAAGKFWIYDAKSPMPADVPRIPETYYSFDPNDSY
jgi:hypothetical protein